MLPHYRQSDLNTSVWCSLHGWQTLDTSQNTRKIIDAFLFSIEFDIFEIRLRELWSIVDVFIVMESNITFSGHSKPLWLKESLAKGRFSWANSKIKHYECNKLRPLLPGESPFQNEKSMRQCMTEVIRLNSVDNDLIIVGDVDEIPRHSTIELFRKCSNYPDIVHLQMKTYFYSFEFYYSNDDFWQCKIIKYNKETFNYNHQKESEYLLTNSGKFSINS